MPRIITQAVLMPKVPEPTLAALRSGGRCTRYRIIWRIFRNMARWIGFRKSFRLTRALLKNNTPVWWDSVSREYKLFPRS